MDKDLKARRQRLLRVLGETGPRKRTVCLGLLGGDAKAFDELLAEGKIVRRGDRKGARYAKA